ncbi:MAG: 3-phosphoserine/phosphohydroxythreonine transaminase [Planctomycetota bacterium]
MTTTRAFNFSAGPCTLPTPVLERLADELPDDQGTGTGVVEMSHRSKPVVALFDRAHALVRELLAVPDTHEVVFVAGGATFQFGMVPMNFLGPDQHADYCHCGAWSKKAIADAKALGNVNLVFDGSPDFMSLPDPASVKATPGAQYLHLCSNETIGGVQWKAFPTADSLGADVPVIADMSSDILSRPLDVANFGLIYAGAQKNIGPAGATLLIIRKDLLDRPAARPLTNYLTYANHVKGASMLNTPPVFSVYAMVYVLEWLRDLGGVTWAQQQADTKSKLIYDAIAAAPDFYTCPVDPDFRSTMNVVFTLPSDDLTDAFVKGATAENMPGLKGHRSVGGARASLYNAMPIEGAQALAQYMANFATKHG